MPWANFDDQFPKHPKVLPISDAAFRLHVSGVCYCVQYLTDGVIEAKAVPLLVPRFRARTLAELVERGLWVNGGEQYLIHDFLQWNRSREQVEADRERKRKAGRMGAESRWGR